MQGTSKERSQGRRVGTSALVTLILPQSLCTSAFWVSQGVSPKIILLNGRVSCRSAHLWLLIPGDERGRVAGTDGSGGNVLVQNLGSPRFCGQEEQAPGWCLSCSDVVHGQTCTYTAGLRVWGGNSSSLPGHPRSLWIRSGTPSAQGRTRHQTSLLMLPVRVFRHLTAAGFLSFSSCFLPKGSS